MSENLQSIGGFGDHPSATPNLDRLIEATDDILDGLTSVRDELHDNPASTEDDPRRDYRK